MDIETQDKQGAKTSSQWHTLARDWEQPKTLAEIYALVRHFPFKAKVVAGADNSPHPHIIPLGEVVEFVDLSKENYFFSTKPSNVYIHMRRWALVED